MSVKSYALVVAYDGTNYLGWQKTLMGPSIQEEIEKALTRLHQFPIAVEAASRTDAGVHAEGQVVQFSSEKSWQPHRLRLGCNALLPPDIAVLHACEVPSTFHPTLDAQAKLYRYQCCVGPIQLPQKRLYSWHIYRTIDQEALAAACQKLQGTYCFRALTNRKKGEIYANHIRSVEQFVYTLENGNLQFAILGNAFTYKLVRNLVGLALYTAMGKIDSKKIPQILSEGDRREAGITAPAHGLTLQQVLYSFPLETRYHSLLP